jgi:integrase
LFDESYGVTDTTTTFEDFVESTYWNYVEQNNVNKGAKKLYIKLLLKHFRSKALHTITPQDCRDCRSKLQYGKNQRKKKNTLSPSSINRIMSTLSKIFTLACEEGILDRNPMQYVKALPEPPPRKRLLTALQKEALWRELEADPLLYRLVQFGSQYAIAARATVGLDEKVIDFENQRVWVIVRKDDRPVRFQSIPLRLQFCGR